MLKVDALSLSNIVYFKEASVKFNHPFTVISGHNRDSRISENTSNGAGKSLLLSTLPNLIYESAPLSGKRSKKEMLGSKSSVKFSFNDGAHDWTVEQLPSKYVIMRDGKDLEVRTTPLQRKMIEEIFPITEDEFYSYIYLQSQRPLAFQIDKPAERLHYITRIFSLDVYDRMKRYFTAKLGEISNKQVEYDVTNNQLLRVNGLLERVSWNKANKAALDETTRTIERLREPVKAALSEMEALKSERADAQHLKDLRGRLADIKIVLTKDEIKVHGKVLRAYQDYERELVPYETRKERLTSSIASIKHADTLDVKDIEAKAKKGSKRLSKLTETLTEMSTLRKQVVKNKAAIEEAKQDLESLGGKPNKLKTYLNIDVEAVTSAMAEAKGVLNLESMLHECESGSCPTCMQSVNIKKLKKHISNAKEVFGNSKTTIALYESALVLKKANALDTNFDQEQYDTYKQQYAEIEGRLEQYDEDLKTALKLNHLREELSSLVKPKKVPKPKYTETQLEEYYEAVQEQAKLKSTIDELETKGTRTLKQIKKQIDTLKATGKAMSDEYETAQVTYTKLSVKYSEFKVLNKERKELLETLESIKPIIEQRGVIKALEKAYSAKGLKVTAANLILQQIEANLNRYSNLIFAEPFTFKVFADEKGVHCIVDRGKGKVSDVRLLSGAESDCFRLLWMWVMLVMVDDKRRTNFAILDEPDSHMDETTRSLFVDRFLPTLRTLVSNVFLITPLDKNVYSECRYLTVVKEQGVSRVVENSSEDIGILPQLSGQSPEKAKSRKKPKKA